MERPTAPVSSWRKREIATEQEQKQKQIKTEGVEGRGRRAAGGYWQRTMSRLFPGDGDGGRSERDKGDDPYSRAQRQFDPLQAQGGGGHTATAAAAVRRPNEGAQEKGQADELVAQIGGQGRSFGGVRCWVKTRLLDVRVEKQRVVKACALSLSLSVCAEGE
ncbi:hypothetical protein CH63R_07355 [Colletotrichum higginsianum IMI 349063]|uniref:Uncharacterized protein n=1 Tax=Colletotrichum higginsianum (strain IMI 349063) TaxID=759273 RepID=A0A1B7Y9D0_COLHI|nr:hypothetical protein CH63R_07355 [Colletotrichum higginsianum IMI 349063]OBR08590.1 hypothetical protein CH63R_07355 [Colletotrichum higginsianum IMI 349063]